VSGPVLITGGAGSVGQRLVEKFLAAGQDVRVFDLERMDFSNLEGRKGIEIAKGDITNYENVAFAVAGASAIVHLAAILPPVSERSRDVTFRVNVDGTENIIRAMHSDSPDAKLVFSSSISTYGDTSAEEPPVTVDHSQSAIDVYADSKIHGEALVRKSGLNTVVLRIAGVAVPAFLEPPVPWPFMKEQRIEMVHRDDVVDALLASVIEQEAARKVYNIGGGPTWQLLGRNYAEDFFNFMGAPPEEAVYRDTPGWVDWYDTGESQRILKYQNRSYQFYSDEMRAIVEAMMAE
jgi:nucleoside-diphosphate-sugar epimerase